MSDTDRERINKSYYYKRKKLLNHLSYHVEEFENVGLNK